MQGDGCVAGDLPLGLVLVVGLQELRVLPLDLLGVSARRAEQQLLQVVVQVLARRQGDLPVGDPCFQIPDDRGARGECGQGAGVVVSSAPYLMITNRPGGATAGLGGPGKRAGGPGPPQTSQRGRAGHLSQRAAPALNGAGHCPYVAAVVPPTW